MDSLLVSTICTTHSLSLAANAFVSTAKLCPTTSGLRFGGSSGNLLGKFGLPLTPAPHRCNEVCTSRPTVTAWCCKTRTHGAGRRGFSRRRVQFTGSNKMHHTLVHAFHSLNRSPVKTVAGVLICWPPLSHEIPVDIVPSQNSHGTFDGICVPRGKNLPIISCYY